VVVERLQQIWPSDFPDPSPAENEVLWLWLWLWAVAVVVVMLVSNGFSAMVHTSGLSF
jgi:hypothetical protein